MLTHVSRLYLGRAIPQKAGAKRPQRVSDLKMARFINDVVAPRFPDGWTRYDVSGGWRDAAAGRTVFEASTVLEVAHDNAHHIRARLIAIASAYKLEFHQDAVMMSTVESEVIFV